jgi:O-succinylbenzoate synthase
VLKPQSFQGVVMQISGIEIHHISRPLVTPFNTAFADTYTIDGIVVRLESDGVFGWGEADPWGGPFYSGEWAKGAFELARSWLAPRLIGRDISSGEELQGLLSPIKGNYFAKSAFDLAWWDLKARQEGVPLWQLLGGQGPIVEVGADFGVMETPGLLLKEIEKAVEDGYPRVKLKVKPGWDVDVMRLVRKTFPDTVFHVDCNSGYTLEDIQVFHDFDEMGLAFFEQPLTHDDLVDHAELARQVKTLICLDESITTPRRATQAIEMGACGMINIKCGRTGGVTNSVKILNVAREAGIPCWIGGMAESSIGASHCLALATLPGMGYPHDIFPTDRFFARDLTPEMKELHGPGTMAAFDDPGIGCTPDMKYLEEVTLEKGVVQS